jgi:hypothetical protein
MHIGLDRAERTAPISWGVQHGELVSKPAIEARAYRRNLRTRESHEPFPNRRTKRAGMGIPCWAAALKTCCG